MADPFDPARLPAASLPAPRTPPRPRPGEKFLKGPVPWGWVEAAVGLPGRALAVGLAVWMEAGCRNRRAVAVSLSRLARLGMTEKAARRAVQALERAGLVTVDRAPGRGLVVTLAHPPTTPANGASRGV